MIFLDVGFKSVKSFAKSDVDNRLSSRFIDKFNCFNRITNQISVARNMNDWNRDTIPV